MKAFTLVEVLVSLVILSFLIVGIFGVLNIGNIGFYTDMVFLDLQQQSRQAIHWMVKELRESKASDISIVSLDEDDDQITFSTPNEAGIQYYRDVNDINNDSIEEQIIREYPAGTQRILASDISSLQFSLNNQLLEIQLTANRAALSRDFSFPLKINIHLRNE